MTLPLIDTNLPDRLYRGKVRDTFDLGEGLLLMVATDRISAFDVVLPSGIPDKGYILSRMSVFWFNQTTNLISNHMVGMADDIADFPDLINHPKLQSLPPEIARQAMVVKRAERVDVECVVRGYITGSAWAEYVKTGTVSGLAAPVGMQEGDMFDEPLFTPTTKAEIGHDENISMEEVEVLAGKDIALRLKDLSIAIYKQAHDYAKSKGILLADTKMEFGLLDGNLILIDELLTPDSSRFWDLQGYAPGKSQPNYDKQFVRDWLVESGWDREPPAPELPDEIIAKTRERYFAAYEKLTG